MTESKIKTWTEFVIAAKALDTCHLLKDWDEGLHTPTTQVRPVEGVDGIEVLHDNGDEWAYGSITLLDFEPGEGLLEVFGVHNHNEPYFLLQSGEVVPYDEALADIEAEAITPCRIKAHYGSLELDGSLERVQTDEWARFLFQVQDLLMLIEDRVTSEPPSEGMVYHPKITVTLTLWPGIKVNMTWEEWGYGEVVLDWAQGTSNVFCSALACSAQGIGPEFHWTIREVLTFEDALHRIEDWAVKYW